MANELSVLFRYTESFNFVNISFNSVVWKFIPNLVSPPLHHFFIFIFFIYTSLLFDF